MKLTEIAKAIANHAHMPYSWEDVLNRLKEGHPLPYKLFEYSDRPLNKKVEDLCAKCGGKLKEAYYFDGTFCRKCLSQYPPTT